MQLKIVKTTFTYVITKQCAWGFPKIHLWNHRILQNPVLMPLLKMNDGEITYNRLQPFQYHILSSLRLTNYKVEKISSCK
jgi:hypothetical protein